MKESSQMATTDHPIAKEMMSAALDQQLSSQESAQFAAILADSPEAKEEYDGLKRIVELVANLPTVEAPDNFYEKLSRKMRKTRFSTYQPSGWISLVLQVLSILVVLMIAAIYLSLQLERDPKVILEKPAKTSTNPPSTPEAEPNSR